MQGSNNANVIVTVSSLHLTKKWSLLSVLVHGWFAQALRNLGPSKYYFIRWSGYPTHTILIIYFRCNQITFYLVNFFLCQSSLQPFGYRQSNEGLTWFISQLVTNLSDALVAHLGCTNHPPFKSHIDMEKSANIDAKKIIYVKLKDLACCRVCQKFLEKRS